MCSRYIIVHIATWDTLWTCTLKGSPLPPCLNIYSGRYWMTFKLQRSIFKSCQFISRINREFELLGKSQHPLVVRGWFNGSPLVVGRWLNVAWPTNVEYQRITLCQRTAVSDSSKTMVETYSNQVWATSQVCAVSWVDHTPRTFSHAHYTCMHRWDYYIWGRLRWYMLSPILKVWPCSVPHGWLHTNSAAKPDSHRMYLRVVIDIVGQSFGIRPCHI